MASLGQELRRERELRAVTLKEIANLTKISLRYLQALEEDRLDILPGPFFVKGVIRAFAKAIGADEDYFLNKYHADALLQTYAVDRDRKIFDRGLPVKSRSRLYAIIVISGLALAILLSFLFLTPHKRGRAASAQPQPASEQIQTVVTPPPRVLEPVLQAQKIPLKLELSFLAETWIQVYADGELKIDGLKLAGEKAACLAQKEFVLNTGNAGGFALTINGQPGKPLGGPGIVLTDIKITTENYGQFLRLAEKDKQAAAG
jgi:transcriptional regulator with XRE-family HTH domain